MAGNVTFKFTGLAELERAMKELGQRASTRIADRGLSAGTGVIIRRAKEIIRAKSLIDTGLLLRSVGRRRVKRQRKQDARVWIMGVEKPRSRIFHLHEFGTSKMAARPFMRPALDEKQGEALIKMAEVMAQALEREANRLAKR